MNMWDDDVPNFLISKEWSFFDDCEVLLKLPKSASKLERKFEKLKWEIDKIIVLAHENRHASPPPIHTPKGILKQIIYYMGQHYMSRDNDGFRAILIKLIEDNGGRVMKSQGDFGGGNIFYLCFRVFAHERAPIKGGELFRLSHQLLYANDCMIEPKNLIGFIYQNGGKWAPRMAPNSSKYARIGNDWNDDDGDN